MYLLKITLVILLTITLFSCEERVQTEKLSKPGKPVVLEPDIDPATISTDFMPWWTYYANHIVLSSDFIGLDETANIIGKQDFLDKLTSGKYIPLKLASNTGRNTYQLFELDATAHESIGRTISNESRTKLYYFNMEGQRFPAFEFVDLEGTHYTRENTQGKTIILKTWYINCQACIAEFPELNEFVEKYQQRDDLVFLSLALDTKSELDNFLQKKNFQYQVVPDQASFIGETLNLRIYPTHLIIDERGVITKVVNKAADIIAFFEKDKR